MRDLHAVESAVESAVDLGPGPLELDQQIRVVKREQRMAGMAIMLLDAAKILEPVVELLCDRALRWAALLSTVGLASYAMREPSWERAAIVAGFAILAPWVIRRGRS